MVSKRWEMMVTRSTHGGQEEFYKYIWVISIVCMSPTCALMSVLKISQMLGMILTVWQLTMSTTMYTLTRDSSTSLFRTFF